MFRPLRPLTALAEKDEPDLIFHMLSGIHHVLETLASAAKETGTFIGDTVNQVTHQLPYVPMITEAVHFIGNLLSKNTYKPEKLQLFHVGTVRFSDRDEFHVNGMLNSFSGFLSINQRFEILLSSF